MTSDGATAALCRRLVEQRMLGVPDEVVATARSVVLDGLGCLVAGLNEPPSVRAREQVAETSRTPEASAVGLDRLTDTAAAAFVNGVTMHSLDFEAVGTPACHGTSSVLPALLALAERDGLSGAEVVTAFVLGWEVECRLRTAGELRDAFHPTAVHGPIAAAAAAGLLVGLDAVALEHAIAIAASSCGGLAANGRSEVKALHAGNAARTGVQSADLARKGLHGSVGILERSGGFGDAFFAQVDWAGLLDNWGEKYFLRDDAVNFKPYPVQFPMINVVDTVLDARSAVVAASAVGELRLVVPTKVISRSNPHPHSGHAGKFSPEYCAAVALVLGEVGIEAFTDEAIADPRVRDIMMRTSLTEAAPGTSGVTVEVVGQDGTILGKAARLHQRGSRQAPLRPDELHEKVRRCLRAAGAEAIGDELVAVVGRFETADHVTALMALLRFS
ncbi:putative 2-methylcitrate dehydratase [metagenome]|uniref:Putative 2-methylcitrate dehydratase n=1 Tax=metagenome TaxID=256318 RepID=A0A2P2C8X4_9ZZZZ